MDLVKTTDKILNQMIYINEENFFLNLAVRLDLNYPTTKLQVKEIHKKISTGEKELTDYSVELQKIYFFYLDFLGIKLMDNNFNV
jgi:hypothetical protein